MPAHTPGPWDCACWSGMSGEIRWIEHCPLHAAAPALLEALESMVKWCDRHDWGTVPTTMEDRLRAAIAQAKGETV